MPSKVHVAVGILFNAAAEVLIAFRDPSKHQGALWEFPGGKLETAENVHAALRRELSEELGLIVGAEDSAIKFLLKIEHDYGDKQVLLDVWEVLDFEGEAIGREGQGIRWVAIENLSSYQFPAANLPIVKLLRQRLLRVYP
jgi:8-oxo-dGTP diphosphatase